MLNLQTEKQEKQITRELESKWVPSSPHCLMHQMLQCWRLCNLARFSSTREKKLKKKTPPSIFFFLYTPPPSTDLQNYASKKCNNVESSASWSHQGPSFLYSVKFCYKTLLGENCMALFRARKSAKCKMQKKGRNFINKKTRTRIPSWASNPKNKSRTNLSIKKCQKDA